METLSGTLQSDGERRPRKQKKTIRTPKTVIEVMSTWFLRVKLCWPTVSTNEVAAGEACGGMSFWHRLAARRPVRGRHTSVGCRTANARRRTHLPLNEVSKTGSREGSRCRDEGRGQQRWTRVRRTCVSAFGEKVEWIRMCAAVYTAVVWYYSSGGGSWSPGHVITSRG